MLLAALLLQLPDLLPPVAAPRIAPDPGYAAEFEAATAARVLDEAALEGLRPQGAAQEAVLLDALLRGGPRELRLACRISAGSGPEERLSLAAAHAAWRARGEADALAALLAPSAFPAAAWPALAWMALDQARPIGVRAAATGRLLRAGCRGAWPVARSFLRTGTALDEQAPWADWNRLGRYELPKRLLVGELDAWLAEHDQPPSGFEPNAPWQDQVDRLAELEPRVQALLDATAPVDDAGLARGVAKLLRHLGEDQERAWRAAGMLLPHARITLQQALAEPDPMLQFAAQRAFALLPD